MYLVMQLCNKGLIVLQNPTRQHDFTTALCLNQNLPQVPPGRDGTAPGGHRCWSPLPKTAPSALGAHERPLPRDAASCQRCLPMAFRLPAGAGMALVLPFVSRASKSPPPFPCWFIPCSCCVPVLPPGSVPQDRRAQGRDVPPPAPQSTAQPSHGTSRAQHAPLPAPSRATRTQQRGHRVSLRAATDPPLLRV